MTLIVRYAACVCAALILPIISGCGQTMESDPTNDDALPEISESAARAFVSDILTQRANLADGSPGIVDQLIETNPAVTYEVGDARIPGSELLIVGSVAKATEGRRFVNGDGPESIEVDDFGDDPSSMGSGWRTLHLEISINQVLGSADGVETPEPLVVGVAVGSEVDVARLLDAFREAGEVVLPLVTSPVFDYEPTLMSIAADGRFLTFVENDGSLDAAVFAGAEEATFLEGAGTLKEFTGSLRRQ